MFMKNSKKAQVSMEVMSLGAIMTLALVIATVIFVNQYYDVSKNKEEETLNLLSEKIKSELELAKNAEPGYYRSFNIPDKINGKDVKVEVYVSKEGNFSEVRVKFDPPISEYIESTALIGEAVFGSVNAGENKIIKNEEGVIIIPEVLPENVKTNISYVKITTNNTEGILKLQDGIKCDFYVENYNPEENYFFKTRYFLTLPNEEKLYSELYNVNVNTEGYPEEEYKNLSIFSLESQEYNTIPEGSNVSCIVIMEKQDNIEEFESQNFLTLQDTLPEIIVLEQRADSITDIMNAKVTLTLKVTDVDEYDNVFLIDFISSYLDCNNETRMMDFDKCTGNEINKNIERTFYLPLNTKLEGFNSLETIPIIIQVKNINNTEETAKKEINIEINTGGGFGI